MFPILAERRGQAGGTLSGGEQQMLAVARALMGRPKLLLLDEPSLGLAPLIVVKIFEVMRQLNHEGMAILLVEQAARMALEAGASRLRDGNGPNHDERSGQRAAGRQARAGRLSGRVSPRFALPVNQPVHRLRSSGVIGKYCQGSIRPWRDTNSFGLLGGWPIVSGEAANESAKAAPRSLEFLPGADPECFICRAVADTADRENLLVERGQQSVVILNRFPYNNGHLLVAPLAHKGRLERVDRPRAARLAAIDRPLCWGCSSG